MSTLSTNRISLLLVAAAGTAGWATLGASRAWSDALADSRRDEARLGVESCDREVGQLDVGSPARAAFHVANRGTQRLILTRQLGDCDCSAGPEGQIIVPAGAGARLNLEFATDGLKGPVTRKFHFRTNDPQAPDVVFSISGDVRTRGE